MGSSEDKVAQAERGVVAAAFVHLTAGTEPPGVKLLLVRSEDLVRIGDRAFDFLGARHVSEGLEAK